MTESLTSRTLHGLKWSYFTLSLNIVLQIVITAIMARLIAPSAYGLVAMAFIFIRFGNHFAQLGIGPALIQKPELKPTDIGTAYGMSALMGLVLCFICWLLAPLAPLLFPTADAAALVELVRISAFLLLIGPITSVSTCLLRREMRFRFLGIAELICFAIGVGGVGISLAAAGYGPLALIIGPLVQAILICIATTSAVKHHVRPAISAASARALFSFGGRYSLAGFCEMLTYNADVVVISQFVNASLLGIYNRASYLIQVPAQQLAGVVNKVGFVSFSQAAQTGDSLQKGYISALTFFGLLLFPFCLAVAIAADEVVRVVLGTRWLAAGDILQILAIGIPFHLGLHLTGIVYDALDRLWLKLSIRLVHLCVMVAMYISVSEYGLMGFALAFTATEIVFYLVYSAGIVAPARLDLRALLRRHAELLRVTVPVGIAVWLAREAGYYFDLPVPGILAAEFLAGCVFMGLLAVIFPSPIVRREIIVRLLPQTRALGEENRMTALADRYRHWLERHDRRQGSPH